MAIGVPDGYILDSPIDALPEGYILDSTDVQAQSQPKQSFFHIPRNAQEQQIAKQQDRAALEQGLQGATFGFGDEVAGTLGGFGAKAYDAITGNNLFEDQSASDVAKLGRQAAAQQVKAQQEQFPALSLGANLVGGLLTGGAVAETATGSALANSLGNGNVGARIAKGAIAGATSGGLYGAGTADEGRALSGAERGAIGGAVIGGAIPAAGAALGAVKNAILPQASEDIKPLAQKALNYGIPLSRTQIGDSEAAKTIASATGKIPLSGAAGFQKQQQEAFNREVLDTIGAKGNKATPELLNNTYKKIGNKFDEALSGQKVKISDEMIDKLGAITSQAKSELLPEQADFIEKQADRFTALLNPDGTIDGEKLGKLRSSFSRISTKKDYPSEQLMALKNFVQDVSVDGAPERKEVLQDAINKFRHYQIVKPLLNKAVRGDISPSLLLGRVSGKSGFSDFAQGGGGKLGDLARIGQAFLKDPIPNSGTAQRQMVYKALEGGGTLGIGSAGYMAAGIPGIASTIGVPIGLARGMNTLNTSQRLVRGALASGTSNDINMALSSAILAGQLSSYNRR